MNARLRTAALILIAAVLGFWLGHATRRAPASVNSGWVRAVPPALPPPPSGMVVLALPFAPPPPPVAKPVSGNTALTLLRIETVVKGANPQACLVFSGKLAFAADQSPADFITVTPDIQKNVQAVNERLCVSGFAYGTLYQITARQGLKGEQGAVTVGDESLPFNLGNVTPKLRFSDGGFVLPRTGNETLPISTVNLGMVHVLVERITDRVLARTQLGEDSDSSYDCDDCEYYNGEQGDLTLGAQVFNGEMKIKSIFNQSVTTGLPVSQLLGTRKPGAYRITVSYKRKTQQGEREYFKNRWVIDSDIMLTSLRGEDGLHVFARSLSSAKPVADVQIALLAANNDELGRVNTDSNGDAVFAPGLIRGVRGLAPRMVMAYFGDDFSVLDLDCAGIDLSDRGVTGRAAPGAMDGFLYAERGIFRPGETIQASGLLRDRLARALGGQKLSLLLLRPDGVESSKYAVDSDEVGAFQVPVPLSPTAARGTWRLQLKAAGTDDEIGSLPVEVQDFVPNRLRVEVTPKSPRLAIGGQVDIEVGTRYLYGAPAADLKVDGTVVLRRDTAPFGDAAWQFGVLDDAGSAEPQSLSGAKTDQDGHAVLTLADSALKRPGGDFPLIADVTVAVAEPGGRATEMETHIPLVTHDVLIGLRDAGSAAGAGDADEATPRDIEIAAFSAAGARVAQSALHFSLVEEVTEFGYYSSENGNGGWAWRTITHDRPISFGSMDISAAGEKLHTPPLGWGRYRLDVSDDAGAHSSARFYSGYESSALNETPEMVRVSLEGKAPKVGESAHVRIKPPFAGEMLLTVQSDRVLAVQTASIPAEGAIVDIKATDDWGPGAYVMASVYRPVTQAQGHAPVRAIGISWVKLDSAPRTLKIAVQAPDVLRPRRHVDIPVTISNIPEGEPVYLTLAAVDEGILQLTRFETPDPEKYYYGQRRLAVNLRDDYARLIDGNSALAGMIRSGGDSDGAGLSVVPTRTTALFSGLVRVDAQGHAVIPLDLPDFNGGLRFMLVAASTSAMGHSDRQIPSRDPVVAEVSLPRFLAPKDAASLTLLAHNVDAPAGVFHVHIAADGAVAMTPVDADLTLAQAAQMVHTYPISGGDPGIGHVHLTLDGAKALHIARDWNIQVRPAFQAITRTASAMQAPQNVFHLTPDVAQGLYPAATNLRVTYSAAGKIDVAGLLSSLDEYPYGCTEQLTSRALPLLYMDTIAAAAGGLAGGDFHLRVQQAIDKILERQDDSGAVGLWRVGDSEATPYLGAYVADFLARAKQAGYAVPNAAMDRAYLGLDSIVHEGNWNYQVYWWNNPYQYWRVDVTNIGVAYADLLKARAGRTTVGELRYFADTTLRQLPPLAQAQLGTALSLLGDSERGAAAFDLAEKTLDLWGDERFWQQGDFYRSELRDTAEMVALAAEINDEPRLLRLLDRLDHREQRVDEMTTQQQAWLAVAAGTLIKRTGSIDVSIGGEHHSAPGMVTLLRDLASIGKGIDLINRSANPVLRSVVVRGLPVDTPAAFHHGLTMTKTITGLAGEQVDLAHLRQNMRLLVHLSGDMDDDTYHQAMIADLLPAGFEIEKIVPRSSANYPNGFDFLGDISPTRMAQKQDDRFLAAVDLSTRNVYGFDNWHDSGAFNLAYIVRVVTPGTFTLPAASIRDMYRSDVMARTDTSSITVESAK